VSRMPCQPEHDRGEDDAASIYQGVFVVAARESAPVLEVVEGAFNDAPREGHHGDKLATSGHRRTRSHRTGGRGAAASPRAYAADGSSGLFTGEDVAALGRTVDDAVAMALVTSPPRR